MNTETRTKPNDIAATLHISESELTRADGSYSYTWHTMNRGRLNSVLFHLGMDTNRGYTLQPTCLHVNRLGDRVTCQRYYGNERLDNKWLESGYASLAATDKSSGGELIEDLYSSRMMTEKAQADEEYKDIFRKNEES